MTLSLWSVIVMLMTPSSSVGHREMSVDQRGGLSFPLQINPIVSMFVVTSLLVWKLGDGVLQDAERDWTGLARKKRKGKGRRKRRE